MKRYDDVDALLADAKRWRAETVELRRLLLACGLDESVKWGKACYGKNDRNLAIVQPFKAFVALMFFKGALLDDPKELLEEQGKNTRSARRVSFTSVADIRTKQAAALPPRALGRSCFARWTARSSASARSSRWFETARSDGRGWRVVDLDLLVLRIGGVPWKGVAECP